MNGRNIVRKNYIICTGIVSIISTLLFWAWAYTSESLMAERIIYTNVRAYAIGIILFGILLFISLLSYWIISKKINGNKEHGGIELNKKMQYFICFFLFAIGAFLFSEWGLVSQHREFGEVNGAYYYFPLSLRVVITIAFLVIIYMYIYTRHDISKIELYASYFVSLLISFLGVFVVNPYCEVGALIDTVSITETIYNVVDLIPYNLHSSTLYGHYGLFFLIPLKIFGTKFLTIAIFLAFAEIVEHICFLYIINSIKCRNWIKAIIALGAIVRPTFRYPAVTPIRTVWPIIVCAWIVYLYNNSRYDKKYTFISYLLVGLSILWNTETGIGCLFGILGFYVWIIIKDYLSLQIKRVHVYKQLISHILLTVFSIFFPIALVNLYNFFCGYKRVIFRSFFFPLYKRDFSVEFIRTNVPIGNHIWMYIISILLGCFVLSVFDLIYGKRQEQSAAIFAITSIGIVIFCYYFNEAHWGCLDIMLKICAILSTYLISKSFYLFECSSGEIVSQIQRAMVLVALFIWGNLAVSSFLTDPVRVHNMYQKQQFNTRTVLEDANNNIEKNVPENIYGVGVGISIIYHELGWDNYAHYRDLSSIDLVDVAGSHDKLVEEMLSHDEFLIDTLGVSVWTPILRDVLCADNRYELRGNYFVCGKEYSYYSRKSN